MKSEQTIHTATCNKQGQPSSYCTCGADEKALMPFVGKFVNLSLRFSDGRTREFNGLKLLSVGSGGGMLYDCWPTSFRHSEVVSCIEHGCEKTVAIAS